MSTQNYILCGTFIDCNLCQDTLWKIHTTAEVSSYNNKMNLKLY